MRNMIQVRRIVRRKEQPHPLVETAPVQPLEVDPAEGHPLHRGSDPLTASDPNVHDPRVDVIDRDIAHSALRPACHTAAAVPTSANKAQMTKMQT